MIGLGVWEIPVNSFIYSGKARVIVKDNGGEYEFEFEVPDMEVPKMDISNVCVTENTLTADATCALLKGKMLHTEVTFEGDTCTGFVKGPMGVRIKLNGKRI